MPNNELYELLQQLTDKIKQLEGNKENYTTGLLKFTQKEISQMPKTFKKEFRLKGCVTHIRKRTDERYKCSYEIRYRRNGYNISVSATTIEKAKARFIEKLKYIEEHPEGDTNSVPRTFKEFSLYYFENFRKRKVRLSTYKNDLRRFEIYLLPVFGSTPLKSITPVQCQRLIDEIAASGKGKTCDEVFTLLNVIFKMAIKHDLIRRNPLDIVLFSQHERKHGKALTKEEEAKLLIYVHGTPYETMFAIALYTGLRPNEFKTAVIDGNFIVAVNSKQKDGKVRYKKIPITPMLQPYLKDVTSLNFYVPNRISEKLHEVLPEHRLYDCRTTFYTRCQECGVAEVALKKFMGHSLGVLGESYTDISDEYLLREGQKLKY